MSVWMLWVPPETSAIIGGPHRSLPGLTLAWEMFLSESSIAAFQLSGRCRTLLSAGAVRLIYIPLPLRA